VAVVQAPAVTVGQEHGGALRQLDAPHDVVEDVQAHPGGDDADELVPGVQHGIGADQHVEPGGEAFAVAAHGEFAGFEHLGEVGRLRQAEVRRADARGGQQVAVGPAQDDVAVDGVGGEQRVEERGAGLAVQLAHRGQQRQRGQKLARAVQILLLPQGEVAGDVRGAEFGLAQGLAFGQQSGTQHQPQGRQRGQHCQEQQLEPDGQSRAHGEILLVAEVADQSNTYSRGRTSAQERGG
jgi:hypothetical protein